MISVSGVTGYFDDEIVGAVGGYSQDGGEGGDLTVEFHVLLLVEGVDFVGHAEGGAQLAGGGDVFLRGGLDEGLDGEALLSVGIGAPDVEDDHLAGVGGAGHHVHALHLVVLCEAGFDVDLVGTFVAGSGNHDTAFAHEVVHVLVARGGAVVGTYVATEAHVDDPGFACCFGIFLDGSGLLED